MNLTHGQKVWCEINGEKQLGYISINNGKFNFDSVNYNGHAFLCVAEEMEDYINFLEDCENYFEMKYVYLLSEQEKVIDDRKIKHYKIRPYTKDINDITTYEVGDVLIDRSEETCTVRTVTGDLIGTTHDLYPYGIVSWYTVEGLIKTGWNFKDIDTPESQKTTVTMQEIADWKGVPVDSIEIK